MFSFRIYPRGAERMTTSRAKLPSISTSWRCCHAAMSYSILRTLYCNLLCCFAGSTDLLWKANIYKNPSLLIKEKMDPLATRESDGCSSGKRKKKSPTFLTVVYYLVWNAGKVLKYFWQLKLAWSLWRWTGGQSPLQCSYRAQDSHLRHDSTRRQWRVNGGSTVRSERQEHLDKIQKNTFRVPALFRDVMFKHLLLSGCSPVSVPRMWC